jgi:membrane-bound lytic murein transglycosylase F
MLQSIRSSTSRRTGVWSSVFTSLSIIGLVSCSPSEPPKKPWQEELTVIVIPSENRIDAEFSIQLSTLFAEHLHSKVKFLTLPPNRVMQSIATNKAHFAASELRSNEGAGIRFGPSYQTVIEQAVCRGKPLRHMTELLGKNIAVIDGSTQEAALREARKKFPGLHWRTRANQSPAQLLKEVAEGKLECTVVNEEQLALSRNYYPDLSSTLNISTPSNLAWAFSPNTDTELILEANKFFTIIQKNGKLHRLLDSYYGHSKQLGSGDAIEFITKMHTVLPHFRGMFEEAATLTRMKWQLLAALAYQESHWNPLATSSTNVRGMMMLTEDTADRMSVTNRLDPHQSIIGGAKYLLLLKDQLPLRIKEPDRTWLALAAYNQGYGHLEDARILAKQQGYNPDKWIDLKQVLPLLTQPAYFEQTKYGYARGGEAVFLVEIVRKHYELLTSLAVGDVPRSIKPVNNYKIPKKSGG